MGWIKKSDRKNKIIFFIKLILVMAEVLCGFAEALFVCSELSGGKLYYECSPTYFYINGAFKEDFKHIPAGTDFYCSEKSEGVVTLTCTVKSDLELISDFCDLYGEGAEFDEFWRNKLAPRLAELGRGNLLPEDFNKQISQDIFRQEIKIKLIRTLELVDN